MIKKETLSYFNAGLILLLIPFLILSFYCWPSGDDYSYAFKGRESSDFIKTVFNEWFVWNGRFTSNFLVIGNPISKGWFWLYQLTPILLICSFIYTNYLLCKKVLEYSFQKSIFISVLILIIYLILMPHLGEGIYWYSASVTYFIPTIIIPIYLITLYKFSSHYSITTFFFLIIEQLILTGFNEIILLYLLILNLAIVVLKRNKWFVLLLVLQITFCLIVYFAPGNDVRSSQYPLKGNLYNTIIMGFSNTGRYFIEWVFSPIFLFSIILIHKIIPHKKIIKPLPIWVWVIALFTPLFIACALPVWTTGIIGQQRTVNLSLYLTILICFLFWISEKNTPIHQSIAFLSSKIKLFPLFLLFIFSCLCWKNERYALIDLYSGNAKSFNTQSENREKLIQSFKTLNDTIVKIPTIKNRPKTIFIYDIQSDCDNWQNGVYMQFYNLEKQNVKIIAK